MLRHCQSRCGNDGAFPSTQKTAATYLEGNALPLPKNHTNLRRSGNDGAFPSTQTTAATHLEGNAPPLPKNHTNLRRCRNNGASPSTLKTPAGYVVSVPLVDGKAPSRRGSIVVAISSARAKPLKIASAM